MKIEPSIDYPGLLARIKELYALPVTALTFIPEGEVSIAYLVDCADSTRYFLKLWANTRQGQGQRAKLDVYLPITHELYQRGLLRYLPAPIPTTTSALHSTFGDYALALFLYIEGCPLRDSSHAWELGLGEQLAQLFAKLHRATPLLASPFPRQDAFETTFAPDLRRGLAALDTTDPHQRPAQWQLRDLLLPRRPALLAWLHQTEQLAEPARQQAKRLVLCHTDMGGHNVFVDAAGITLYALDWDDLILAPAEHDLQEHRGPHFAAFLAAYIQSGGIADLHPLQFRFYLQRRYLADLTDWLIRILEENTDPAQDAYDLAGIQEYSLAGLDNFTTELDEMTRTLVHVIGHHQ
jgi:hypothetical protein